ncbi:MAG: alpha/beta fold hydrolase [Ignavibacteriae bacterium]|nr:alpha/beta fold hydrolase [Ignavibacteriota bacterium]
MSYIRSKDAAIYYEEHGSGETLILLPGLVGTIESHWRRFIPEFAKHFHVIAVDLRGHGRTNNPSAQLHLYTLVADLFAVIESLEIDAAHVCGYSLGGYIGLAFGIQHPGTVKSLLMHGTKFYWDERAIAAAIHELSAESILLNVPAWGEQLQREHAAANGEDGWKILLASSAEFLRRMPAEGLSENALQLANFPVFVTVGDADEMVPAHEAEMLGAALPYGMVHVFPNTRHPIHKVEKQMFLEMAYSFFNATHRRESRRTR